jgi:thymidylate synthase
MQKFERDYAALVAKVLKEGERRSTRNADTVAIFGESLVVEMNGDGTFPLIQGRKMYPAGVFGEFAAMIREPKSVADFERWGCNYWKSWAKPNGSIEVDYGNAWFAGGQIARLKDCLANNPTDRRMLINAWRPERLNKLDLPCCHYSYQFYVREGKYLDMLWSQRSVDVMVGLPSDIVLAATWLIMLGNEFGLLPGRIKMDLGDTHVYHSHIQAAEAYLDRVENSPVLPPYNYTLTVPPGTNFLSYEPTHIELSSARDLGKLPLELHA